MQQVVQDRAKGEAVGTVAGGGGQTNYPVVVAAGAEVGHIVEHMDPMLEVAAVAAAAAAAAVRRRNLIVAATVALFVGHSRSRR